jgi:hypothetical protein
MLLLLSLSIRIVIDVGSAFFKSATTTDSSPPEIGLNPQSKSLTPAFISFRARSSFNSSQTTPLTEDEAELLQVEIGEKAVAATNLRPLMGTGYFTTLVGLTASAVKAQAARLLIPATAARISQPDLLALFLKLYIDSIARGRPVDEVTLVFPAHFTAIDRAVFAGALEAVNITRYSEVDDVDAVAASYAAKNTGLRTVLFVDVGATAVRAYAMRFGGTILRLSYALDRKNGGAFVTAALVDLLRSKTGVVNTSFAEQRRLFTAAEKVKIGLAEAESADVVIADIGGIDRPVTVTRAEFANYSVPLIESVIRNARKASQGLHIDAVELLGGSVPLVAEKLNDLPITCVLHPVSAVAIGGALPRASIVDNDQLFDIELDVGGEQHQLCARRGQCITELTVPGINFRMYLNYSLNWSQRILMQEFRISRNPEGNVTLKFRRRPFKFIGIDKCNESCVPGRFIYENRPAFNSTLIELFYVREAKGRRLAKLKAEVEEMALRVLDDVSQNVTIRTFTNHTQRIDIIRCAERQKNWISQPEVLKLTDPKHFTQHLTELRKCMAPVYRRMLDNVTFWKNAEKLYETLSKAKDSLNTWKGQLATDDAPDVFKFDQRFVKVEKWFNESLFANSHADMSQNLPIKPKAFLDKWTEIDHDYAILKEKYGRGFAPTVKRGDGSTPDPELMKRLNEMPFMQKMKDFDWDQPKVQEEEDDL